MILKDKKLKKQLDSVPHKDKNGDPIFKIAGGEKVPERNRKDKRSR